MIKHKIKWKKNRSLFHVLVHCLKVRVEEAQQSLTIYKLCKLIIKFMKLGWNIAWTSGKI